MKLNEIKEVKAGDLQQVKNYVSGNLDIRHELLTSLEVCPEEITGNFYCSGNQLESFEHFPKHIDRICYVSRNYFTSFKDIDQYVEYIGSGLFALDMNITSGFSDLFGIDGLRVIQIDNDEIQDIVVKYLPSKDLINFQDEMIKSGYESYL